MIVPPFDAGRIMLVHVTCGRCQRQVKVSSRFAGRDVACPHCRGTIAVPPSVSGPNSAEPAPVGDRDAAVSGSMPPPVPENGPSTGVDSPRFEWLEPPPLLEPRETAAPTSQAAERIAVSRSVILMQGVLLALTAIAGFVFGWMTGVGQGSGKGAAVQPCFLDGKVMRAGEDGPARPDAGAVVLIFPRDERPDAGSRVPVAGLRPNEEDLETRKRSGTLLRAMGADLSRAGDDGHYHLRVRRAGHYYVLSLSGNIRRNSAEPLDRTMLAELGRYVDRANELIGSSAFQWRELEIRSDTTIQVTFR